jgi:EmrB/QacA subfamily drug resistance transporter
MPSNDVSRKPLVLVVLCLAVLVVGLDVTILNVALPTIGAAFSASNTELQWIVDAYLLSFAGGMLPAGRAADRFGRKRLLLIGLGVLGAASAWSALAGSVGALIAARAAMGVGAAIVMPAVLAVVPATFSERERPRAIAVITAAIGLGLPLGPIVGGALLDHFAWGAVFWINVPFVALAGGGAAALLRNGRSPEPPPADLRGAALGAAAVVALVYGIVSSAEHGVFAAGTVGPLAAAVVLGGLFVAHERRLTIPLVDVALFADRRFAWGTAASVVVTFALYGVLFVIPQFLQAALGHDAFSTGLRLVPLMLGLLVGAPTATALDRVLGTNVTVAGGLAVLAAGLLALASVDTASGSAAIAIALAACGVGVGASMAPAMDAVIGALPDGHTGVGAALNNTLRQVGGALAVAALGSLLSAIYADRVEPALAGLSPAAAAAARDSLFAADAVAGGDGARHAVAVSAFVDGMGVVLLVCAAVATAGALLCLWRLPRTQRAAADPAAAAA